MSTVLECFEPVHSHDDSSLSTEETIRRLELMRNAHHGRFHISPVGSPGELVEVSVAVIQILITILNQLAHGNGIKLLPMHAELPTEDAAEFLNVSNCYLNRLLDEGKIRFQQVGPDRRMAFRDLAEYKERSDIERRLALEELASLGQEIGEGY
jgi:excisionase family DNA binding protein